MLDNRRRWTEESAPSAGWVLWIVCVAAACTVWFALASAYVDAREIEGQCFSNTPPGAVVTESSGAFTSDRTAVPAGRLCTYDAQDGGTIQTQTGWPTTIAAFAGTGIAGLMVITSLALWRRTTPMQRVLTASALLAIVLGWVSIAIFASAG